VVVARRRNLNICGRYSSESVLFFGVARESFRRGNADSVAVAFSNAGVCVTTLRMDTDRLGNIIDTKSHRTHAMNPIDRNFYAAEEWDQPAAQHEFRCMFCGALDQTSEAATPCSGSRS